MPDQWPYEQITDHEDRALSRFTYQYADADMLKGLTRIWAERMQGLEDSARQLLEDRWLDAATGQQLDELGEIVGEPRLGRNDDDYREAIEVRITINRSGGEPERIIEFLTRIAGADTVLYQEAYPAKIEVFVNGTISINQAKRVRDLVPAGVGTIYITETGNDVPFGTKDGENDQPTGVDGLGELDYYVFTDEDGFVVDSGDGYIVGGNDIESPLLPREGGYIAELYEV